MAKGIVGRRTEDGRKFLLLFRTALNFILQRSFFAIQSAFHTLVARLEKIKNFQEELNFYGRAKF